MTTFSKYDKQILYMNTYHSSIVLTILQIITIYKYKYISDYFFSVENIIVICLFPKACYWKQTELIMSSRSIEGLHKGENNSIKSSLRSLCTTCFIKKVCMI